VQPDLDQPIATAELPCADRVGFARLTTMAFNGTDLRPLRDQLISKVVGGTAEAGEGLDLSLIAQLLGDKPTGLAIQAEVLTFHQLFRSPCAVEKPKLRVLALAASIDMGGNTPIEFLLEDSAIELLTLYVVAGVPLPVPLPDHDIAMRSASSIKWRPAGRGHCSIRRVALAIWTVTSCIICCVASRDSIFPQPNP
jgi:hypothetical protein